jgi:hypothetical protein
MCTLVDLRDGDMTRVEIIGLEYLVFDQNQVRAACVRHSSPGPEDGYEFEVSGWVVGAKPIEAVEFLHDRKVVGSRKLTLHQPVIEERYGLSEPCGFWRVITTVGLMSEFTVCVRVVFEDGSHTDIAEIRGRHHLRSTSTAVLRPLMVSSLGRSGSTWVMRMLGAHPQIVAHAKHPYETHACSYWLHVLRVLAQPMDEAARPSPYSFLRDETAARQFPYYHYRPHRLTQPEQVAVDRWLGGGHVDNLARTAQDSVESFYQEYAAASGKSPVFFAEKSFSPAGHYTWLLWQLYPEAREVFLIRDPRDLLASALAFNRRRGFDDFGREHVDSDEAYVAELRQRVLDFARQWRQRAARARVLRYEDLVEDPGHHLRLLLAALQLDDSIRVVDAMVDAGARFDRAVARHRTTPDGPSSVGRWTRDLPPALRARCTAELSNLLSQFEIPGDAEQAVRSDPAM